MTIMPTTTTEPAPKKVKPADPERAVRLERRRKLREERARLTLELTRAVGRMSLRNLRTVAKVVHGFDELESWEATEELRNIPGCFERIEEGRRQIAEGKGIPLDEVRRRV